LGRETGARVEERSIEAGARTAQVRVEFAAQPAPGERQSSIVLSRHHDAAAVQQQPPPRPAAVY
jgi:hypothetical protein